jgi:ATP-binding cassette subfamily E protein 1
MKRRIAIVDKDKCRPDKCGYACIHVCPKVRAGEECVVAKERKKPFIDENICIGCGICVKKCPFKAITIVNLPEQLQESPIHRYGENEFTLFRLPYPVEGQVVGLLGANGTGKTTALQILSGKIKPNLGNVGEEVEYSNLIKIFRGTELQNYLEKLQNKEIKTAFKPQRVDKIPEFAKGKISKLLEKVDERRILNSMIERLKIENILDKDISEVSGGELQRIAIVATLAKDADIYYIDEPSSFLDVFQRLEVAKLIREFTQNKACMVVDHDLATLDFLADRVHIFYGVPGAYGVVSKPYGVRVGINTFLDGYIKEDNIRIRPEPITFETSFVEKKKGIKYLVSFENIGKKLGNFVLHAEQGKIYQKEVLGVLGANALGKTTFARILAGEIEPDSGKIEGKIKISYKPQYPSIDFDGSVEELLSKECENYGTQEFKTEIMNPLDLEKLLDKNVQKLSGGEFQRVVIAIALAKKADLYLLDEPSAYQDVEQRLALAKSIRRLVESRECAALVIDHDLLFLSQISDRAMVFLGKPGIEGHAKQASVKEAFNEFLKEVNVTFRRDVQTGRPRANKLGSKLDRLQKEKGVYFYM